MESVCINGINLNINIQGEGQPLVLLHGVGGDQTQFRDICPLLAQNFKVITLDARGHGKSDKPKSYTLGDHVADVIGIMDHFNLPTIFLNGVSMGSYIAQGVAIAAPERISKLILTVPKSNGLESSIQRLITEHAQELIGLNQNECILMLLKYFTYDPDFMKHHVDIFETKLNTLQFAAANDAIKGFNFKKHLSKIKAKTLVISGKYDGLNPPDEGRLCASLITGAAFVEMQYSGHAPMFEEPEIYLNLIREFLLR